MPDLIPFIKALNKLSNNYTTAELLDLNQQTGQYGLMLSPADAELLAETRNEVLRANGRIETSNIVMIKLINTFCQSAYISQQEYTETLLKLLELFYDTKNEALDIITDDELIELMYQYFEERCMGSLEQLQNRELELLSRNLRYHKPDYANMEELDDELILGDEEDE